MNKEEIISFIKNSLIIEEQKNGKLTDLYIKLSEDLNNKINDVPTTLKDPDTTDICYIPFYIPNKKNIDTNNIKPQIIFQTWISRIVPKNMYKVIYDNLLNNDTFDYFLFDDNDCEKFMNEYCNDDVYCAYKSLVPPAYKADLWRYCVIYKYGGIYADIKFILRNLLLSINEHKQILLRDRNNETTPPRIYQALFILNKSNNVLEKLIKKIIENVRNNYYGWDPLVPTGPGLFGQYAFENKPPSTNYKDINNINFILPNIKLFNIKDKDGDPEMNEEPKLFSSYEEYRNDQKEAYSKLIVNDPNFEYPKDSKDPSKYTKHYDSMWNHGKSGEDTSLINKQDENFYKGIYKNNLCNSYPTIINENNYLISELSNISYIKNNKPNYPNEFNILYINLINDIKNRFKNLLKPQISLTYKEYYVPFYIPARKKSNDKLKVPLIIFQTWQTHLVPKDMYNTIHNNLILNPEFDYYLFDDNDCEKFIKDNFPDNVLCAFNKIIPGAFKADLWRYCIIHKYGGVYADIKFKIMIDLKKYIEKYNQLLVKDKLNDEKNNSEDIYQAAMILIPEQPFLLQAINKIIENVKNNFYGKSVLHPTGPRLLGEVINSNGKNNLKNTELQVIKHTNNEYKDLHLVCSITPNKITDINHLEIDNMTDITTGQKIPIVCKEDSTLIFESYESYRREQDDFYKHIKNYKQIYKNVAEKHYGALWDDAVDKSIPKDTDGNYIRKIIAKDLKGNYTDGIYLNNNC